MTSAMTSNVSRPDELQIHELMQIMGRAAAAAAEQLARADTRAKDLALSVAAAALRSHSSDILEANAEDLRCAQEDLIGALRDRLTLDAPRIEAMAAGLDVLVRAGAEAVVIACNTAHYWYDELARTSRVPILHIADAACAGLAAGTCVGLLGTEAALQAGIYQSRLGALGVESRVNAPELRRRAVLPAIALVKQGRAADAGRLLEPVFEDLRRQGADTIILACTELPLALDAVGPAHLGRVIDPTRALARAAVAWSFS